MKSKSIFFLLIFLISVSCEQQTNIDIISSENKFLIVNGLITNENIPKSVELSYSVNNLNQIPEKVTNATVFISDGDTTYTLVQDSLNPGIYVTDKPFIGVINKTYSLRIYLEDKNYNADARMLPVSFFDNAEYKLDTAQNLYYISYLTENFDTEEAAMWKISLDWSSVEGYTEYNYDKNHALLYFYKLTTIDVSEIFAPPKEKIFFPKGTIITQTKYSLNAEHEKFIRSLLMESEWAGGIFDLDEGNVYTNLSNGALGFFGASSVITSTFVVE